MATATYKIVEDSVGSPGICNDCWVMANSKEARGREWLLYMHFGISFTTNIHRAFLRFNLSQPISGTSPPKDAIITSAILRWRAHSVMPSVFTAGVKSINPVDVSSLGTFPSCPTFYTHDIVLDTIYRLLWEWGDVPADIYAETLIPVGPTEVGWYEADVTTLVQDFLQRAAYNPANQTTREIYDEADPPNLVGLDFLYNNLCLRFDEGDAADNLNIDGNAYLRMSSCQTPENGAELIISYELAPVTLNVNSSPSPEADGANITVIETAETLPTPAQFSLPPGTYNIQAETEIISELDQLKYRFDRWEDGSTANPRLLNLTGNFTITAFYVVVSVANVTVQGNQDVPYYLDGVLMGNVDTAPIQLEVNPHTFEVPQEV